MNKTVKEIAEALNPKKKKRHKKSDAQKFREAIDRYRFKKEREN